MYKKEKGVTLLVLVVMIVVLLIIAGITISIGTKTIEKAGLESVKTNMLLIQAKAKEYVENANFKQGKNAEITDDAKSCLKGTVLAGEELNKINYTPNTNELIYSLSQENLNEMGVKNVDPSKYFIVYDVKNCKVEIIYADGVEKSDGTKAYTLTEIEKINS